jgi:hypothetical protein
VGGTGFSSRRKRQWLDTLGTGRAAWQCKILTGYQFIPSARPETFGVGAKTHNHGAEFSWDFQLGHGNGWSAARTVEMAGDDAPGSAALPLHWPHALDVAADAGIPRHLGTARFVGRDIAVSQVELGRNDEAQCASVDGSSSITIVK